jgi:hypothetical protein
VNVSPFMRRYFIVYGLTLGLKQRNSRNLKIVVFSILQKRQDLSALSNMRNKRTIFVKIIWCHEILADFPQNIFLKVFAKICVTQEQLRKAVENICCFSKKGVYFHQKFSQKQKEPQKFNFLDNFANLVKIREISYVC